VVALTLPPPPARPPAVGADAPGRGRARQLRLLQRAAAARGGPSAWEPARLSVCTVVLELNHSAEPSRRGLAGDGG
jgi:hypothetical protein